MNGKISKVILADDDEDDREIFVEAIHDLNSEISIATLLNGVELMKALNTETVTVPDIIFLDLNMPLKNGFECLTEIRLLSKLQLTPVIVYSTSSNEDYINRTYKYGANLYIQKPQSFSQIKKVIAQVLSLKHHDFFPQPVKSKFVFKEDLKSSLSNNE